MNARRVLCALLLLVLPVDLGRAQSDAPAHWTVLYYMNADCSDGDAAITPMLKELMRVGSTAQVEVLAYIDRGTAPCPVGGLSTVQDGKLYRVMRGHLVELASGPPLANTTAPPQDPNLGDVNTLAWFLETALNLAPSEKIALFTVGHGALWRGLGADATPNDWLEFAEFRDALARVLGPQQRKVSVLGLLNCGVSCMEGILPLATYADWILASEDLTHYDAIPSAELLHVLRGSQGPEELARLCVRMYRPSPRWGQGTASGVTLIDTRHATAVAEALDRLATRMTALLASGNAQMLAELRIAKLLAWNLACGADQGCDDADCPVRLCCMVDLLQVATRLTLSLDPGVAADARCLVCQLQNLVAARSWAHGFDTAGGVSIFLPCRAQDVADYGRSALATDHAWGALLDEFLRQPCQECGSSGEPINPAIYRTTSEALPVSAGGFSKRIDVSVESDAIQVSEPEAWLSVRLEPDALPQLMLPAQVEPSASGYRLSGTWNWTLPFLETHVPEAAVPLAIRFPRQRAEGEAELVAELPLLYLPKGAGPEHVRSAVATLVLGEWEGEESIGWVRSLRQGRSSGIFAPIEIQQGDALLAAGTVLPGKGPKDEGPPPPRPPSVISLPPRIVGRKLPNGTPVWLGFTVLTADGTYADIRISKAYAANAHPALPLTPK